MNAITEVLSSAPDTATRVLPWRDRFGALSRERLPADVQNLLLRVLSEIGFREGVIGRRRGGYDAFNCDVYGYDVERNLIALQVRHTWCDKDKGWTRQQKWYGLAGEDEGQLFSHVIPTSFRRIPDLSCMTPAAVVRWAESKIFRVPVSRLGTMIRQGDVALVPVRAIPRTAVVTTEKRITIRGSHEVFVDGAVYKDHVTGRRWADGLIEIDHQPGEHRAIDAEGRFEIVAGTRLNVDFNTVD